MTGEAALGEEPQEFRDEDWISAAAAIKAGQGTVTPSQWRGVIVGRALYIGRFTLAEATAAMQGS